MIMELIKVIFEILDLKKLINLIEQHIFLKKKINHKKNHQQKKYLHVLNIQIKN